MAHTPTEWMDYAACRHEDQDIFFPPQQRGKKDDGSRWEKARAICSGCPCLEICRLYAEVEKIEFGMWGGQTPVERGHRRNL